MHFRQIASIRWISLFLLFSNFEFAIAQDAQDEFKPTGKIWGYAFGDFYIKSGGDTATWASKAEYSGVPKNVNAFALRRMYLGYDYFISPTFASRVLLEAQDPFQDTRGDRAIILKALFMRWHNIYKGADLFIGQMPTLAFASFSEKIWNNRKIEKTIIDQRAIRNSSELGISLRGKLDTLGNYGYNLLIGNGSGTKPEELTSSGKGKIFSAEIFGYFLKRKVLAELYSDYLTGSDKKNQALFKTLLACQTDRMVMAIEAMYQVLYHNKSDGTDTAPFGISVFARGMLVKDKLGAFARFDSFNQDMKYRDQDVLTVYDRATMFQHYDEQFFVAGFDYSPHANIHLMPNIWINSYKAKGESSILVDRKADVVPRLTFMFSYK